MVLRDNRLEAPIMLDLIHLYLPPLMYVREFGGRSGDVIEVSQRTIIRRKERVVFPKRKECLRQNILNSCPLRLTPLIHILLLSPSRRLNVLESGMLQNPKSLNPRSTKFSSHHSMNTKIGNLRLAGFLGLIPSHEKS